MSYIAPTSTIHLLKNCPLDIGYKNTFLFPSSGTRYEKMKTYCPSGYTLDNNSYVRHTDNSIKIGKSREFLNGVNYMIFVNPSTLISPTGFENVYYYAFVTDIEYVNNNTSIIYYSIDDLQTYWHNIKLGECFIEREHVYDDSEDKNLIEEGSTDLVPIIARTHDFTFSDDQRFIGLISYVGEGTDEPFNIFDTLWEGGGTVPWYENPATQVRVVRTDYSFCPDKSKSGFITNGLYNDFKYFTFPFYTGLAPIEPPQPDLVGLSYKECAKGTAFYAAMINRNVGISNSEIISVQIIPESLYNAIVTFGESFNTTVKNSGISIKRTFGDYTPLNKKLYHYPYSYCTANDSVGVNAPFLWEKSSDVGRLNFKMKVSLMPEVTMQLYPTHYNGLDENYLEAAYTTINQQNYTQSGQDSWWRNNYGRYITTIAKATWGFMTGTTPQYTSTGTSERLRTREPITTYKWDRDAKGSRRKLIDRRIEGGTTNDTTVSSYTSKPTVTGYASSALDNAGEVIQMINSKSANPSAITNLNSSVDALFKRPNGFYGFKIYEIQCREEFARRADKYFTMYGYEVDEVKVPNIQLAVDKGDVRYRRKWFNYLKCASVNLIPQTSTEGVPQEALDNISEILKNGITFWSWEQVATSAPEIDNYSEYEDENIARGADIDNE